MVRCAYCKEEDDEIRECSRCNTAVHLECVDEHGSCPVCGLLVPSLVYPPPKAVLAMKAPAWSPTQAQIGLLLVILGLLLILIGW